MKTVCVNDIKEDLPSVLEQIEFGMKGLSKKENNWLGSLQGEGPVIFADDFKMTEEELISL